MQTSPLRRLRLNWPILACIALALPLILPFLAPGLPVTADGEIHLHRVLSALMNIRAGYLWPRWTPYLHQGFGYPIHNFYPPGVHIVGAVLVLAGVDPVAAVKMIQIAATLLYPLGAYLFARTLTGKSGALLATAVYLYAPFRFHELWVQGNLSQFVAMALLPWLLWAISRGAHASRSKSRGGWRWLAVIGLFFAAIVISHHPTAVLFAPVAGVYALMCCFRVNRRALVITVGGLALGLALSAIYWIPAIVELPYTHIDTIQHDATFNAADNLLPIRDLLSGNPAFDRTMLNSPNALRVGWPQMAAALFGLLALLPATRLSSRLRVNIVAGAAVMALCIYLMSLNSAFLWRTLPFVSLIVYPWRLLGVAAVLAIPGAAAIPELLRGRWRNLIAGMGIAITFSAALPLLYLPLAFRQIGPLTPASTIAFEQRTGDLGLTSDNEYLPRWATQRPLYSLKGMTFDQPGDGWRVWLDDVPGVTIQPIAAQFNEQSRYEVQSAAAYTATVHQMYFPGWNVTIDGQEAAQGQSTPYGLITVPVPAGTHDIALWYGGTTIQHGATALSLIAVLATLLILIADRRLTLSRSPSLLAERGLGGEVNPATRLALVTSIALIAFVIINQTILIPDTSLFRPRSDPASPPAQFPAHETFGGAVELAGYDLDTQNAAPGQTIVVQLYWRMVNPIKQSLRGSVQLTDPSGQNVWAQTDSLTLGVSTQSWQPDRYVVDRYLLHIKPDAPPFVGTLRVSVFPFSTPIQYLTTSGGANSAAFGTVRVTGNYKTLPDDQITASGVMFGDAFKLLGTHWDTQQPSCLLLRWQVIQPIPQPDYTVMLHILDSSGQMITALDGPPLDGQYPTGQWSSGQILDDTHCLTLPAGASSLAVGLYAGDSRLSAVTSAGESVKDGALTLPLSH